MMQKYNDTNVYKPEQEIPFVEKTVDNYKNADDEHVNIDENRKFRFTPQVALRILALYITYVSLGMCNSTEGPSLPELETFFKTTTSRISLGLASSSVGFLAGSILGGFVIERLSYELQIGVTTITLGVFVALPPFSGSLGGYIGTMVPKGIALGYHNGVSQTYVLYVMMGSRLQGSMVQGMHLVWSAGSALAPIIMQPFISERQPESENNVNMTGNNSVNDFVNSTVTLNVRYGLLGGPVIGTAFLIFGAMTFASSIPMWYLLAKSQNRLCKRTQNCPQSNNKYNEHRNFSKRGKIVILCVAFIWCHQFLVNETLISAYLSTWAINGLNWSAQEGAKLTTILWISHCCGRICAIPLAALISPQILLTSGLLLTTTCFVILAFLHHVYTALIWAGVVGIGLGMASLFGAFLQWFSRYMRVTGGIGSIFITGVALGRLTSPIVTGFLMDVYSPHWMLYIGAISSASMIIIYAVLELMMKLWYRPRHRATIEMQ